MIGAWPRAWLPLLFAGGSVTVSLLCFYLFHAGEVVAALLLMLWALVVGVIGNRFSAILASFAAAVCLDYLFIPPIFRITIDSARGWVGLFVFLAASLIAAGLSSALRRQRDELSRRQLEAERLHALSRALLLSDRSEDTRRLLVNRCMELFGFEETVLFEAATGEFWRSSSLGTIQLDVLRSVAVKGAPEVIAPDSQIIPVALGNKLLGSLGYRGMRLEESAAQSLSNTLATGLAQAQAHEAGNHAEAVRRSEELKSVMIDALAHDLKTPLTAIEVAAETLIHTPALEPKQRTALTREIEQAARTLRELVHGAIHLARIDAKRLRLEARPILVNEAIESAIYSLGDRAASHEIVLETGTAVPCVLADSELLVQALKQLLDNALKYSPARSRILVCAEESGGWISISVRDHGPGLTELEQGRVFEKFYRGRATSSNIQGTGMGLAIAKEIAEAHGGAVGVESQIGEGTRFTITLRAAARLKEQPA